MCIMQQRISNMLILLLPHDLFNILSSIVVIDPKPLFFCDLSIGVGYCFVEFETH